MVAKARVSLLELVEQLVCGRLDCIEGLFRVVALEARDFLFRRLKVIFELLPVSSNLRSCEGRFQ